MGSTHTHRPARDGFTVVELLVVIFVIGVLIALLMPAVQAAREAARRSQCKNNLRQLAQASFNHEDAVGHLPSSGWGWGWTGEPDRGFGRSQPGGWAYNILPFMEYDHIHDMGAGGDEARRRAAAKEMVKIPLPEFICPTRRPVQSYPYNIPGYTHRNIESPDTSGRSDYAMSSGGLMPGIHEGPPNYAAAESYDWPQSHHNGVSFQYSEVTLRMIADGTSKTYLIGEKYLNPNHYFTGESLADNQFIFIGHDIDVNRWSHPSHPPLQDRPGFEDWYRFGSAHAGGFHMTFCDGSVRTIDYSIDPDVHRRQGSRSGDE